MKKTGAWNLAIGLVLMAGGLSKKFTLLGTASWEALVGLGAVIAGLGAYQLYKSRNG